MRWDNYTCVENLPRFDLRATPHLIVPPLQKTKHGHFFLNAFRVFGEQAYKYSLAKILSGE